jgi:hypothetical protein
MSLPLEALPPELTTPFSGFSFHSLNLSETLDFSNKTAMENQDMKEPTLNNSSLDVQSLSTGFGKSSKQDKTREQKSNQPRGLGIGHEIEGEPTNLLLRSLGRFEKFQSKR